MALTILCPDCADEAPGFRYTSRYGGNDPDVWLIPCETCGGGYRQAGTGEISLMCEGWRCGAEADEWFQGATWCSACAAEQKADVMVSGEDA